jgi:hypothetical protein
MKRSLFAAAALVLMTTTAPAKDLLTSGYWKSYVMNGNAGTPICGIQTIIENRARTASGMILVKYQKGGKYLFIQLFKSNWRFTANNVPVKATVSFDGTRLNTEGTAYISEKGDSYVEFKVHPNWSNGFLQQFAEANRMAIEFIDGDEPNWSSSLAGSRNVAKVFAECVQYMGGVPRPPEADAGTQPFDTGKSKPAPTQPFGGKGQPAKPAPAIKQADDGSI